MNSYSVHFRDYFRTTDGTNSVYFGDTKIRLHLRNAQGEILAATSTVVHNPFTSLWVMFNLEPFNLVLKKDETYHLTRYLVDGEQLGIVTGATGNLNEHTGACNGSGLSRTSRIILENHLYEWDSWHEHPCHFNFRVAGKE